MSGIGLHILIAAAILGGLFLAKQISEFDMSRAKPHGKSKHQENWGTIRSLTCLRIDGPTRGRLILGRIWSSHGSLAVVLWQEVILKWLSTLSKRPDPTLLAAEKNHSVMIIGPTQSYKTSGLAIPAILEWEGPVVAVSVKSDLSQATYDYRALSGSTYVFDPCGVTGLNGLGWSPLDYCSSWVGARRAAHSLAHSSPSNGLEDSEFWYGTASKLLAPLLFAGANAKLTMADIVRWVDTQEIQEIDEILARVGCEQARNAAWASFGRDAKQKSSVYTTAETVLEAFGDPEIGSVGIGEGFDPHSLLHGGSNTLYICAPSHEQARLRPMFCCLLGQILDLAFMKAQDDGGSLVEPLLIVIDEAANIAPIDNLDTIASTGASHSIQLLTVWQDISQIKARYGKKADSILNNHRAKIVLSGVSDIDTLEYVSRLAGETTSSIPTYSKDHKGGHSVTYQPSKTPLASHSFIRQIQPGSGILFYGHLPATQIKLRPWYEEPTLIESTCQARNARAPKS